MNNLEYYDQQKSSWTEDEIKDIRSEYEKEKMGIMQMADIHRRTPGSIAYKLKTLGIISQHTAARGYGEYKTSDLYKEIVENNKKTKTAEKESGSKMGSITSSEVAELRKEIASVKQDVKKILKFMEERYEPESEPECE